MDNLIDLAWRLYPATALMAIGATVLWLGLRMAWRGLARPMGDPTKMQTFVRGFRVAVIGVTLAGLGAAWSWHLTWLFVLSLVFGIGEILESSTHLAILRRRPQYRAKRAAMRGRESTPF